MCSEKEQQDWETKMEYNIECALRAVKKSENFPL